VLAIAAGVMVFLNR
jgi:hypothetical protein